MTADPSVRRRRRRPGGVRFGATLVAVIVVAAALVVGALLLVSSTRNQLTQGVEAIVTARAQDLAQLAATGDLPDVLPASRSTSAQILSAGQVISSTGDIEGQAPIVSTQPTPGTTTLRTVPALDSEDDGLEEGEGDDEGPYLVAVTGVEAEAGALTVIVAASLAGVEAAASALTPLLIGGVPVLILLVGVTTWALVGRSLRPVRAMTEQADLITVTDLGRRIPIPASSDEIRQLGETLNRMLNRLDSSVATQRRFVADASHELKSPITSILTMAEVATQHPEAIDVAKLAADLEAEARRLTLLVDDLLTLAQSDEHRLSLDVTRFDLTNLIAEETAHLRTPIKIHLEDGAPVFVEGDRRRLAQAIRNLVDNAARHTNGNIWIETSQTSETVEILIGDDGSGIPPEDRERVFDRFTRLDDARSRQHGGTGLGLAVVRTIIEAHHGQVEAVTDPRYPGALIHIRLARPTPR